MAHKPDVLVCRGFCWFLSLSSCCLLLCYGTFCNWVSKGMWAAKHCTRKILQFLTGGAGQRMLTCVMAVKWLLLLLLCCYTAMLNWNNSEMWYCLHMCISCVMVKRQATSLHSCLDWSVWGMSLWVWRMSLWVMPVLHTVTSTSWCRWL